MNDDISIDSINAAFADFKKRLLQGERNYEYYRQIFLDACYEHEEDNLHIRNQPNVKTKKEIQKLIFKACDNLTLIRDYIVDWVLLESKINPSEDFSEALLDMLDRLVELKSRPSGIETWISIRADARSIFVYETFLYIVAALMKKGAFNILHNVFTHDYFQPETKVHRTARLVKFDKFAVCYGSSQSLQTPASEGEMLYSPEAEFIIKQQKHHTGLPVEVIIEADLLIFMMACTTEDVNWYPQTLYYSSCGNFPFFLRASNQRGFKKIATITGIETASELSKLVKAGFTRIKVHHWRECWEVSFLEKMNMDKLYTPD